MQGRDRKGLCPLRALTLCCLSYDVVTYECLPPLRLHYLLKIKQMSSPAYYGLRQQQTLERLFLQWWAPSCLICFQGHQAWWLMLVMPLALKNKDRALSRICFFILSPIEFLKPHLPNHIWKWEMRPETSMEETARNQSNGGATDFSKHLHATHVGQYSCWASVMLIGNRTGESEGRIGPWPTSPILDETTHGKLSKSTGAELWPWFFIWIWLLVFSATIAREFLIKCTD